jgi:hypothetical protein
MSDALPGDILDLQYINSLPQPLWLGDFPVVRIDVQTGLMAIDACGWLSGRLVDDIRAGELRDANGREVPEGDLWLDSAFWVTREVDDE